MNWHTKHIYTTNSYTTHMQNTHNTISNIKRYRVGESKRNTLLWCKVSQGRRHISALYYKAIIRSDMVKTKEENYNVTYCLYT